MAAWTMTDDGEWILNEPYSTMLEECKIEATKAFQSATFDYISERTDYDVPELYEMFVAYAMKSELPPMERADQFIVRALEGDL